jgi:hypothetical protein
MSELEFRQIDLLRFVISGSLHREQSILGSVSLVAFGCASLPHPFIIINRVRAAVQQVHPVPRQGIEARFLLIGRAGLRPSRPLNRLHSTLSLKT